MRGLIAFGIVLPSSEPTGSTRKFSVPVIGLKITGHSAFMKLYSKGASFHRRMVAAKANQFSNSELQHKSNLQRSIQQLPP